MDSAVAPAGNSARRNEDIALDLLKFVVVTSGVARAQSSSTGFGPAAGPKPEDHVDELLNLYSRCLRTIQGKS